MILEFYLLFNLLLFPQNDTCSWVASREPEYHEQIINSQSVEYWDDLMFAGWGFPNLIPPQCDLPEYNTIALSFKVWTDYYNQFMAVILGDNSFWENIPYYRHFEVKQWTGTDYPEIICLKLCEAE